MTSPLRFGNAILCEYIVEGINKKHTLINTYSGDILVEELPSQMAVAFYIEIYATRLYKGHVEIKLMLGKREAMRGDVEVDLIPPNPAIIAIPMGLLKIDAPATLRLIVTPTGGKPMKAIEKKISLAVTAPI